MSFTSADILVTVTLFWVFGCIVCCTWKLWHMSCAVRDAEAHVRRIGQVDRGPVPEHILLKQLERTHHSLRKGRLIFTTEPQPTPRSFHKGERNLPSRQIVWDPDDLDMVY